MLEAVTRVFLLSFENKMQKLKIKFGFLVFSAYTNYGHLCHIASQGSSGQDKNKKLFKFLSFFSCGIYGVIKLIVWNGKVYKFINSRKED